MDRSAVIYLIKPTFTKNEYGIDVPGEPVRRKVFANVTSVSAAEWYEGGRSGLNPEYRVRMFKYDYEGEDLLEYDGKVYSIYRRYEARTDTIELYAERRQGAAAEAVNGKN